MNAEHNFEQVVASRSSFLEQVLPQAVEADVVGGAVAGPSDYNEGEKG